MSPPTDVAVGAPGRSCPRSCAACPAGDLDSPDGGVLCLQIPQCGIHKFRIRLGAATATNAREHRCSGWIQDWFQQCPIGRQQAMRKCHIAGEAYRSTLSHMQEPVSDHAYDRYCRRVSGCQCRQQTRPVGWPGDCAGDEPFETSTGTSKIFNPIGNSTVANPRNAFLIIGFQPTSRIRGCSGAGAGASTDAGPQAAASPRRNSAALGALTGSPPGPPTPGFSGRLE
jgi:hypothetical protein